jgi:glutamate dehydrogenase
VQINHSHVEDTARLLKDYQTLLNARVDAEQRQPLFDFAAVYLRFFPIDAWVGRELSDLHGFIQGLWYFVQKGVKTKPRIEVFNPNIEEHGWMCGRTVITVLQRDMPFLVDSIRLELNRRDVPIHVVQSTVMGMQRDRGGRLQQVIPAQDLNGDRSKAEALIYVEVNLHAEEQLAGLRRSLEHLLKDIANVVRDYDPVVAKLDDARQNLEAHRSIATESISFLEWLKDSHFTFLGYREYELVAKGRRKLGLQELIDERLGIFKKLDTVAPAWNDISANEGMKNFHSSEDVVFFSKSSTRSNVHRGVYPDYIAVKRFDENGKVCGEARFLGLFTYSVMNMSPMQIPLLRKKVNRLVERTQLDTRGYYGKNLIREIENFPKEELFQSDDDTLFHNIRAVAAINGRHVVRLIVREDPFGSFVNCMVYVPRDLYNTEVRLRIQQVIGEALGSSECDSTTFFSESTLARAQFVFRIDEDVKPEIDVDALEETIRDITNNWESHLQLALIEHFGESKGITMYERYRDAFSQGYQESFDARSAVTDINMIEHLSSNNGIAMTLYRPLGADEGAMRFKVMYENEPLELSTVIPILENLGLRVLAEHPYRINQPGGGVIWMHDFRLAFGLPVAVDVHAVRGSFEEAFANILSGATESDGFNRLILGARLNWREVTLLRAYANYMKQIGFNTTQDFIADTLAQHPDITRNLVALFRTSFDPRVNKESGDQERRTERLRTKIISALDDVANLNEDLTLRRYLDLINATLRTNYFQKNPDGSDKSYISIKFSPREIPDMPAPRPMFEIFVYSPKVEGVHLRGGKVARGGLRWSDRLQDYRTEVLGLVKAQQVKNAVIVPDGAKGGFVPKQLTKTMTRDEYQAEGVACYQTFIRGLLDVTDNLVDGEVITPENVIPKDWHDPYLVVAADRGTATFSDIANDIALEYNFWLGDAFASGGSQGYDHKGMGITARGAWVSVQRHFREKGIDIQNEDFTVIGIGDMAGDVFGNGMLLSEHIKLQAAFNHLHIFIDPDPDPAASFKERQRLFAMPRSSWEDYDKQLISRGGGVFSRAAKSIRITAAMKKAFAITEDAMTPNALINALLKAPVDMIWNGGIGTYVKASWETHAMVGDKANDGLRVDGEELRCQVFGEGGNLGMTQLGRVEFALNGGACNTDFIDNAAGVDCSDHEVNIKILLDELVKAGDLTVKQRNRQLATMTDEVAGLVLQNNYRQTLAISIAEHEVAQRQTEYRRFIDFLEAGKRLDRKLEFLPSDEAIVDRQGQGKSLTRPELSVLISYAKVMLKETLINSDISEDRYIAKEVETAFPARLRKKFPRQIYSHRLKPEIVATQVANDLINNLGITAGHRLLETTGAALPDVARAYIVSRDVFQFEKFQEYIGSLDNQVPAEFQHDLMGNMIRRVRRGTRWFLRNRRSGLDPAKEVATFQQGLIDIQEATEKMVRGTARDEWLQRQGKLRDYGVSDDWVPALSMPGNLFSGLSIMEASILTDQPLLDVAEIYYYLLDELSLNWFATQISEVRVETYWQAIARETHIDDLDAQLRTLTCNLAGMRRDRSVEELVAAWSDQHNRMLRRWRSTVNEVQAASVTDYAMFSVASRELFDLSQITRHVDVA